MKVAMIGLRGIPNYIGGVEAAVENLSVNLVKLGIDVTVYCRKSRQQKELDSYKGIKLKHLPCIASKHTESITHSIFSTFHAGFKDYDLVHYHALGNSVFAYLPRLLNKKSVVTLHGLDWQREKWGSIAKFYLKFCERLTVSQSENIISVSNNIKEYYSLKYKKKITFIPNGVVPQTRLPLSMLKKYNVNSGYILFLSRIVPEKGLHFLINAFKKLDTNKQLLIAGDHTHSKSYFDKIQNSCKDDNRIIFTGPLFGKEKVEVFSNAGLFVLPSTLEGLPIVLLESMSFGLPVLVSNIRENMEVIQNGRYGHFFKSGNEIDLKLKLEDFCYSNLNKLESSEKLLNLDYNWKNIAAQTIDFYRKAMKMSSIL